MTSWHFIGLMVGLVLVTVAVHWIRTWFLVDEVRWWMNEASLPVVKLSERKLKTILALDGHRLPPRVKDAVVQWLAERE